MQFQETYNLYYLLLSLSQLKESKYLTLLFFHIYTNKKGEPLEFVAVAQKTAGCALGSIFKPKIRLTTDEQWMGKVGVPKGILRNDPNTFRTRIKKEINLDTIREKLAYDLYQEFRRGAF